MDRIATRRLFWRVHGWLGLAAGAFVLVVSLTGAAVAFRDDLDRLAHPALVRSRDVLPPGAAPADLRAVVAAVERAAPGFSADALLLPTHADDAVRVAGYRGTAYRFVYADAGSARVLGERGPTGTLGGWLLQLHYTLLLGDWGETFLIPVAVALVLSSLTGLVLTRRWWATLWALPRRAQRRVRPRAWLGAWHRVLGLWSLVATLVLGASGAWLNRFGLLRLRDTLGGHPAAPVGPPVFDRQLSLTALVSTARRAVPGLTPRFIVLPHAAGEPILVQGHPPGPVPFWSDAGGTVQFDATTGRLLGAVDVRRAPAADRLDDLATGLHFGQWGGWPVRLLYTLAGIAVAAVTLSGALVWLVRGRRPSVARTPLPVPETAA